MLSVVYIGFELHSTAPLCATLPVCVGTRLTILSQFHLRPPPGRNNCAAALLATPKGSE
jgi:hypothetical protein